MAAFISLASLALADMNSGGYLFGNPPAAGPVFNTSFDSREGVEFFEVYAGPISTRYGEVFWSGLPQVPLPPDIVKRFKGKAMAVVGYEQDQVIKGENGHPDRSVPIYWAYNHHYVAWIKGAAATMVEVDETNPKWKEFSGHPIKNVAVTLDDPNPDSTIPTSQFFSEGNGGESRKSYHGYPPKRAQLIDSPEIFQITPMQIDTWNRDTKYGDPFKPGPESPQSSAPPNATYSGHLECPCTDRITKTILHTFQTSDKACPTAVDAADVCFSSAAELGYAPAAVLQNQTVNDKSYPIGCTFAATAKDKLTAIFNSYTGADAAACGAKALKLTGAASSYVTFGLDLDVAADLATITLTGPSAVWFGVGLGAQLMKDAPNAIIVTGNGTVFEQKLADQSPGSLLATSVTVVSSHVVGKVRTMVLTRPLKGKTADHYTFNPTVGQTVPFINAIGKSPHFSYHAARAAAKLNLMVVGGPTCVCDTGKQAYINSDMNPRLASFHANCAPEPSGDLLKLHNPSCTIEQYQGGLKCCTSGNILLSKSQNPWMDAPKLTYYMKWRFYFQDYTPAPDPVHKPEEASHQDLVRFFKCTEADNGEYDVVAAAPGTPPEDQIYQITAHFKVEAGVSRCNPRTSPHCTGVNSTGINLIYASHHCHAPSCIKSELWNADTGQLICRQEGHYGKTPAATKENPYDELGYVAIPPCLYGSAADGLEPEPYLSFDTNLTSIKWNNNSVTHYGEMAMWQMRGYEAYE